MYVYGELGQNFSVSILFLSSTFSRFYINNVQRIEALKKLPKQEVSAMRSEYFLLLTSFGWGAYGFSVFELGLTFTLITYELVKKIFCCGRSIVLPLSIDFWDC